MGTSGRLSTPYAFERKRSPFRIVFARFSRSKDEHEQNGNGKRVVGKSVFFLFGLERFVVSCEEISMIRRGSRILEIEGPW